MVPRSLTWEERRWRRRRRWTIGGLEPYRIKVMLVENTRVAGKVRQEIITVLGSIDASYLESFWQRAPDPALRHQHWEALSLAQRTAFWEGVIERMSAIGDNRLSKDDRVAARRAPRASVPMCWSADRSAAWRFNPCRCRGRRASMSRPALASWNCILHDNLCGAATRAVVLVDADHLARRRLRLIRLYLE